MPGIPAESCQKRKEGFSFGIEAEFLVVRSTDFAPLWHPTLSFKQLNGIFEDIPLEGIPSLAGLELEAPMTKRMPFLVEGYYLTDTDFRVVDVLPKGVEIRTPVCSSLEQCLEVFGTLYGRLEAAMAREGMALVALSHHPVETHFSGPQNTRRHDYWQWSMEAMTTYGPDMNMSLPPELATHVDLADLEAKIDHYGPALAALSVASPFCGGKPWKIRGRTGKSFRMHKRSWIAPAAEFHPNQNHRLEFKAFDMPGSIQEFAAQLLSFLSLVLDEGLQGRASRQTRIYDLGQVARFGLAAEAMKERATELLERAPKVLESWGFDPGGLDVFRERVVSGRSPADEMLAIYEREGDIAAVLRERSRFRF